MNNLIRLLMLMLTMSSFAQTSKEMQYAAYLKASKSLWQKSIELAKKERGSKSLEAAIAMYGLLGNTMATKDEDTFDEYKDLTIDLLKELVESDSNDGESRAVLSSVYGLVMAYSPWKGMYLGSRSSSLIDEAMKLEPGSPLIQKLYGGSKLYTPEMFGGDAKEAKEAFKRAMELYESNGDTVNNWLYLDTMMGLAMAHQKLGENELAKKILQKAIALEPDYYWAKSVLEKMGKS